MCSSDLYSLSVLSALTIDAPLRSYTSYYLCVCAEQPACECVCVALTGTAFVKANTECEWVCGADGIPAILVPIVGDFWVRFEYLCCRLML